MADREEDHEPREERGRGEERGASPPPPRREEGRDGPPREKGGETCSLLVRNLSYNVRPDEIKRVFARYGDIRDVYIPTDYYSRKPRGFAFVEFFDKRDATAAIDNLERYELDGREISVVFAKDRRKSSDEMRPARGRGDSRGRGGRRDNSRDRRRGSPSRSRSRDRRDRRSPPRRRDSSPPRRGGGSPPRRGGARGDSPPPARRGGSPPRGRSPPPRRGGSPPSRSPSV